jgi:hypothetical protein
MSAPYGGNQGGYPYGQSGGYGPPPNQQPYGANSYGQPSDYGQAGGYGQASGALKD